MTRSSKTRVEIRADGSYDVCRIDGFQRAVRHELPVYLTNKLNMLRLVDPPASIQGLGYRYNETVFYIDVE